MLDYIEYDGFREHFKSSDEIKEFNYEDYHTEDHVYRKSSRKLRLQVFTNQKIRLTAFAQDIRLAIV